MDGSFLWKVTFFVASHFAFNSLMGSVLNGVNYDSREKHSSKALMMSPRKVNVRDGLASPMSPGHLEHTPA